VDVEISKVLCHWIDGAMSTVLRSTSLRSLPCCEGGCMRGSEMLGEPLEAYRVPWIRCRRWQLKGLRGRKKCFDLQETLRPFLGAFANLRKATVSFVMSTCPSFRVETQLPRDGFSLNFVFEYFSTFGREIQVAFKYERITGSLHEGQYTFMVMSCRILLRMKLVSDKSCREKQNTFYVQ